MRIARNGSALSQYSTHDDNQKGPQSSIVQSFQRVALKGAGAGIVNVGTQRADTRRQSMPAASPPEIVAGATSLPAQAISEDKLSK